MAALVLADNALQASALTLDGLRSARDYEAYVSLVEELVAARIVDRQDDTIPEREELAAQAGLGRGLPRPLLAVLLGQVKRWARERVLASSFPDSPAGVPFLESYFPEQLRRSYGGSLGDHVLRREIVATVVINHVVNHSGVAFLLQSPDGQEPGALVGRYAEVESACEVQRLRDELRSRGLSAVREHALLLAVEDALVAAVRGGAKEIDGLRARLAAVRSELQ